MNDKIDMNKAISEIVPFLAETIVEEAKDLYVDGHEQLDFILSVATNLLANLAVQLSGDDINDKIHLCNMTVDRLIKWYKTRFDESENIKEGH